MKSGNSLELRAHHILCCAAFEGKGYTKEFINKLRDIQNAILENSFVRLIDSADTLCNFCPNIRSVNCAPGKSTVQLMDKKVLSLMDPNTGNSLRAAEYYELLAEIEEDRLTDVCLNCEWKINSICKISNEKIKQFMKRIETRANNS